MKNVFECQNKNMYITSNDTLAHGDWAIRLFDETVFRVNSQSDHDHYVSKKIIFTTNPVLIKNYLQPIPDEFLKWFAKNPTCEYVEILDTWYSNINSFSNTIRKIIIPKEIKKPIKTIMYSEEEVFKLTLDALDLGMTVRQNQLSGHEDESGKFHHNNWFEVNKKK